MAKYYESFIGVRRVKAYDSATARSLAIACDLAYEKKESTIISIAKGWKYRQVEFITVTNGIDIDTQCFVMADDKDVIIVFRGSDDLKDWFANFQAVRDPGPFKGSKAHEGFQDALYPAVIELTKTIDRFRNKNQKLWMTGHSLGGALCSLYAGMLIENGYDIYGIYTFASPRPGDGIFADRLNKEMKNKPHWRVVNTGDIVPHMPPEPFFSHPGNRIILKGGKKRRTPKSWFDERISAIKIFIEKTIDVLDVGNNHRLSADKESYIPRLM
ncbi:MAG: lipase family protein [Candidatus Marinimicrobia bacterium]|nr:lipase family protein [Candidatus Neomarinimicrobiota bacterium]